MNNKFRLLIGYDGSDCSDAALSDLKRAGLPNDVEAVVMSIADVLVPPEVKRQNASPPEAAMAALERTRARAQLAIDNANSTASRGAETLTQMFPEWKVSGQACADSPGWGLIKKADEWKADLIVVGSHGRSALGRFVLGSVAQTVVRHASGSVRIARGTPRDSDSVRLIAGEDGSDGAEAALCSIAARKWPAGSTLAVVTAIDPLMFTTAAAFDPVAHCWVSNDDAHDQEWVDRMNRAAANKLNVGDLKASSVVKEGDPRRVLLEEAEQMEADCIFVGARGLRAIERFLLGSVSDAIATRAPCTVEVVRGPWPVDKSHQD